MTTENRRRHSRYTVEGAGVNAKTIFNTEVEINDISIGGASVSCTRRLNMGSEYLFKFEHMDKVISVTGQVVWAKLTGSRKVSDGETVPIYTFGIEFKDAEDKAKALEDFVSDEIGDVRERKLSRIRVKFHAPERAIVTSTGSCLVTEVSIGGIRLEMEEAPPAGTMLTLEIFVPDSERPIECSGKVAFSNLISGVPHDNRYSVGIEFVYLYGEDMARLERFIDSLPAHD